MTPGPEFPITVNPYHIHVNRPSVDTWMAFCWLLCNASGYATYHSFPLCSSYKLYITHRKS